MLVNVVNKHLRIDLNIQLKSIRTNYFERPLIIRLNLISLLPRLLLLLVTLSLLQNTVIVDLGPCQGLGELFLVLLRHFLVFVLGDLLDEALGVDVFLEGGWLLLVEEELEELLRVRNMDCLLIFIVFAHFLRLLLDLIIHLKAITIISSQIINTVSLYNLL